MKIRNTNKLFVLIKTSFLSSSYTCDSILNILLIMMSGLKITYI